MLDCCDKTLIWKGDYKITNDDSIDDLSGYAFLAGDLIVENTTLDSLDGLECLAGIDGKLSIGSPGGTEHLKSLDGLRNLVKVGKDVIISTNKSLTTLQGLEKLSSIGGGLIIQGNYVLKNLVGLGGLETIPEKFIIKSNPKLKEIYVNSLSSIGTNAEGYYNWKYALEIIDNKSLRAIDFPNLSYVGTYITISGNHSLQKLATFHKLSEGAQHINIHHNNSLTKISGFENFTNAYKVEIMQCPALKEISLNSLIKVKSNLSITNNTNLSRLQFDHLMKVGSFIALDNSNMEKCRLELICKKIKFEDCDLSYGNSINCTRMER